MKFVKVLAACALSVAVVAAVSCKKEPVVDPENPEENPEETPQENPEVKVPDGAVDLGLSVFWATCNLGAATPGASGNLYPFGSTKPVEINSDGWHVDYMEIVKEFRCDPNGNLEREYDCAHVALGGKWRMPTNAELMELINNCDLKWSEVIEAIEVNGESKKVRRHGVEFTSTKNGNSIFLGETGNADYSKVLNENYCYYWTSTYGEGKKPGTSESETATGAYYLSCTEYYKEYGYVATFPMGTAMAVRPVHPKE